jgi:hypothetical protein
VRVVRVPEQVTLELGKNTLTLAGRTSSKATPKREALVLGLVMVNVSELVPMNGMVEGLNDFEIEGGLIGVLVGVAV